MTQQPQSRAAVLAHPRPSRPRCPRRPPDRHRGGDHPRRCGAHRCPGRGIPGHLSGSDRQLLGLHCPCRQSSGRTPPRPHRWSPPSRHHQGGRPPRARRARPSRCRARPEENWFRDRRCCSGRPHPPVRTLIDVSLARYDTVWAAAGHPHAADSRDSLRTSKSRCPPPAGGPWPCAALISTSSSVVAPCRWPPSTWAWITQRRTDSLPTPSCLATAAAAAVSEGYSPTWSVTRRTAPSTLHRSSWAWCSSSWTQTGAASNLGRFITALVYLDAFLPQNGDSCWTMTNDEQRQWYATGCARTGYGVKPLPFFSNRARP